MQCGLYLEAYWRHLEGRDGVIGDFSGRRGRFVV